MRRPSRSDRLASPNELPSLGSAIDPFDGTERFTVITDTMDDLVTDDLSRSRSTFRLDAAADRENLYHRINDHSLRSLRQCA